MLFSKISYLAVYIINVLVICFANEMTKVEAYKLIYTDMINNISLANKIIEDLLKNYENLKKIYKSEEIFHTYSSSFEIDKSSKVTSDKQKSKHRNRSFKKTSTSKYSTLHPVTAIIYESDSSHDEMPYAIEKAKSVSNKAQQLIIVQNKNVEVKRKPKKIYVSKYDEDKGESVEDEYEENDMSDEDIEEIALEMPPKKDILLLKPTRNILNDNVDKKPDENASYKIKHNVFGDKTRFSILRLTQDKKGKNNINQKLKRPNKSGDNTRRIQKIVRSEIFSPHYLWQEVISKPIKLIKDNDPFLEGQGKSFINENNDGIAIIILNQNKKASIGQSRNDRLTKSQILNLLRSTYGDVCLQSPIKKCNKVIKTVKKNVCKSRFNCKSEFKTAFLENGKIGCQKKFSYEVSEQKINEHKNKSNEDKVQPILLRGLGEWDKNNLLTLDNKNAEGLLIQKALRDKYERECHKQSREKCISACEYATNETCSTLSCHERKSQALIKACKNECKTVFIINKGSDTESSDSDSDSDSESDDESD